MKSTAIVCAIAAASMTFGSLAQAQEAAGRGDRGDRQTTQRDWNHGGGRPDRTTRAERAPAQAQAQPQQQVQPQQQAQRTQRFDGRNAQRFDGRVNQRVESRADHRWDQRGQHRAEHRADHRAEHRNDFRHDRVYRSGYAHGGYAQGGYRWDRSHPQFFRGGYVPYQYRQVRYYVNDWNAYSLAPPPYGYQWIQTDSGDFILMALATGLIANLLLNGY